jgi:hypothetical protein
MDGPTEGLTECKHVVHEKLLLVSLFVGCFCTALPFLERFPRKTTHFFVASGKQPHMVKHFGQKSSRVCSSREAKEIYVVADVVVSHKELRLLLEDTFGRRIWLSMGSIA